MLARRRIGECSRHAGGPHHPRTGPTAGRRVHDTAPRVSSPQGRFEEQAALLDGLKYDGAEAFGKHLTIRFDGDRVVHVHLGLFGKFSVRQHRRKLPDGGLEKLEVPIAGQVRLRLLSERYVGDLRGAATCELLTPAEWAAKATRIGADPLRRKSIPAPRCGGSSRASGRSARC